MSEDSIPRAYKEGKADFFGRDFLVSSDVLIPRSETEAMVEMVMSLAGKSYLSGVKVPESKFNMVPRILDIGTGSGCVAITLKLELPEADVWALDISEEALKIAKKNAEKFGVLEDKRTGKTGVKFLKSDLLEVFLSAEKSSDKQEEKFDIMVANLPYVARDWEWLNEKESIGLKYEPELALYAENDGLAVIFRLLDQIGKRTKYLVLEADPCQHRRISSHAEMRGYRLLETRGFQLLFILGQSEV